MLHSLSSVRPCRAPASAKGHSPSRIPTSPGCRLARHQLACGTPNKGGGAGLTQEGFTGLDSAKAPYLIAVHHRPSPLRQALSRCMQVVHMLQVRHPCPPMSTPCRQGRASCGRQASGSSAP